MWGTEESGDHLIRTQQHTLDDVRPGSFSRSCRVLDFEHSRRSPRACQISHEPAVSKHPSNFILFQPADKRNTRPSHHDS